MQTETKAKALKMFRALDALDTELRAEGKTKAADAVMRAYADLPQESAARLYDIVKEA